MGKPILAGDEGNVSGRIAFRVRTTGVDVLQLEAAGCVGSSRASGELGGLKGGGAPMALGFAWGR